MTKLLKNKYCIFLLWEKITKSFTEYFLLLFGLTIIYRLLAITNIGKFIFTEIDLEYTINYLNSPTTQQNILLTSPINIVAIIGFFALFCYIFDLLRNYGLKHKYSKEERKIISPIWYLLISSLFIAFFLIMGYFEGYFGALSPPENIEMLFIIIIGILLLGSLVILGKFYPNKYSEYLELLIFFGETNFDDEIDTISLSLFFMIAGMTIFGLIFFDMISIVIIDLMLLFITGICGSFRNLPSGLSDICLKSDETISNVLILSIDERFIAFLTSDNLVIKITIDSVKTVVEKKVNKSFNSKDTLQTIHNYQISQNQNREITENCINLLKINNKIIFASCMYSVIIGICFYIILHSWSLVGWGTAFSIILIIFGGFSFGIILALSHRIWKVLS